jgi:hypothetical protein
MPSLAQTRGAPPPPSDTLPLVVIVLRRDINSFAELEARLASVGWERRHVPLAAHSLLPGEPEHARWARSLDGGDESMLVYTFNPALSLRILSVAGSGAELERRALAKLLPIESEATLEAALRERAPETVLRAIAGAQALDAFSLAGLIGLVARHPDRLVAQTAARAHLSLLEGAANALLAGETRSPRRVSPSVEEGPSADCPIGPGSTCPSPAQRGRGEPGTNLGHEVLVREAWHELEAILAAIGGNATPLLVALPRLSDDELLGLKPSEEDCAAVLAPDWAERIFQAYDEQWETQPPRVNVASDHDQLQVAACPAALFGRGTPFSRRFPGGYDSIGSVLRPGPIWLAWTYQTRGGRGGVAFDGLVHVRSQWVWFPKLFRVVGERLG